MYIHALVCDMLKRAFAMTTAPSTPRSKLAPLQETPPRLRRKANVAAGVVFIMGITGETIWEVYRDVPVRGALQELAQLLEVDPWENFGTIRSRGVIILNFRVNSAKGWILWVSGIRLPQLWKNLASTAPTI